ncbi:unnamed protein product [Calypogeia fissa]
MERGEGERPAVDPNALHTVLKSDTQTLQDARQGLEYDSNLNGPVSEKSKELSGAERTVTGLMSKSGKKKRSARAASNLRKSLAWDKAFSTGEGVLDIDELPFVTKTPRKPLELRLLDIPEILGKVSPGPLSVLENHNPNTRAVDCRERITSSPMQSSSYLDCLASGSPSSRTVDSTPSKGSSPVVAPSNPDAKTIKLDSKISASVREVVKADALKGTRLRLPTTLTGKRGKKDMPPKPVSVPQSNFLRRCKSSSSILSPSSASAAFSKKVSSVSKKVKDTLGKVLPGSLGGSAKHFKVKEDQVLHQGQAAKTTQNPLGHRHDATEDDVNSTRPASGASSKSSKKKDEQVEANIQEVIPVEQLRSANISPGATKVKVAGTSSKKYANPPFHSTVASQGISRKNLGPEGSQSPQSSKGPSGLRIPSPKIGFFDTLRSASGEHLSTIPERVHRSASDTSNSMNSRKGLPPRPKPRLPSGRAEKPGSYGGPAKVSSKLVSSSIPSAPHLRPSGKSAEGLVRSASTPTSAHTHHHGIRSSASHQAVTSRRLSPQANFDQSSSCVSELKTRTLRNAASEAFQNVIFESRDCESSQSLNPMKPLEVDALPQVAGKPSARSATGYKPDVKFENFGGDRSPSELANLSLSKLPPAMLDETSCQEFERVSSARSANAPELESCSGKETLHKFKGHPAGEKARGPGEDNPGRANWEFGSDSPKATTSGNEQLSENTPRIEDSKTMFSGKISTEERAQNLINISPAKHPDEECKKRNNDSCVESRSTWSDWSLHAALNKLSSQPSLGQEYTPSTTPTFKKLPYTNTVTAENTQKNNPESFVRSSSPTSASDTPTSKHPLAVNAGLINGISKRTSLTASRKERNLQLDFEQCTTESTSGQENKRGLDAQVGGTQLHKPKQRKSNSSHRLDQPEAYGDLFSEERLRALEAAGQESLQKKSGAVQHSPPNKTSPNRNPWSPVRKGGHQPGPFDCTKKYTNACLGQ